MKQLKCVYLIFILGIAVIVTSQFALAQSSIPDLKSKLQSAFDSWDYVSAIKLLAQIKKESPNDVIFSPDSTKPDFPKFLASDDSTARLKKFYEVKKVSDYYFFLYSGNTNAVPSDKLAYQQIKLLVQLSHYYRNNGFYTDAEKIINIMNEIILSNEVSFLKKEQFMYDASIQEELGDIYRAAGDKAKAKSAYLLALKNMEIAQNDKEFQKSKRYSIVFPMKMRLKENIKNLEQ